MTVVAGESIGKYRLTKRIGRGGMAEVLAAEDPDGARVVVKRMLPHLVEEPAYVRMFLREARIAARLRHPNVVRLLDVDRDGDDLFLVFELVDGVTLYELARRAWRAERVLPIELSVRAVADAAIGLHHAHELKDDAGALAGLVHRDVSPDNLMIDKDGVTRLLDFGIAKEIAPGSDGGIGGSDSASSRVSKTGELRGKLAFMSPEQAQGLALDRRSDLFSLGTTLFWLLTAQKPFAGRTDILTLRALLEQDAPNPSSVNPGVPKALDPIVTRMLAKDPDARYANAREVFDDLRRTLPLDEMALRTSMGAFVSQITALKDDTREGTVVVEMPLPTEPSTSLQLLSTKDDAPVAAHTTPTRSRAPVVVAAVLVVTAIVVAFVVVGTSRESANADAGVVIAPTPVATVALKEEHASPSTNASPAVAASEDAGVAEIAATEPDVEVEHTKIAPKRVQLLAPSGITWRARTHGDVAEVSHATKAIVAVDGYGGVHEVPVQNGKADYGALAHGTVQIWLPPTGGEVFIGNKSVGQAPLKPVDLVVGKYKVRAKIDGKMEEQQLVVVAGKNLVRFGPK